MNVSVIGRGPTKVLALHGWLGTSATWNDTVQLLDSERYTFALPDVRGYGSRRDVHGAYTVDEIAQDLIDVADQLGWDTFSVMGHSMGGKAAQRLLSLVPHRVEKMIAITPVPPGPIPFDEFTCSWFLASTENKNIRMEVLNHDTNQRYSESVISAWASATLAVSTTEAAKAYFDSWAKDDITDGIGSVITPILVIVGEHDQGITEDVVRHAFLPFYPDANVEVIAASGHFPLLETPMALASSVDRFLRA